MNNNQFQIDSKTDSRAEGQQQTTIRSGGQQNEEKSTWRIPANASKQAQQSPPFGTPPMVWKQAIRQRKSQFLPVFYTLPERGKFSISGTRGGKASSIPRHQSGAGSKQPAGPALMHVNAQDDCRTRITSCAAGEETVTTSL